MAQVLPRPKATFGSFKQLQVVTQWSLPTLTLPPSLKLVLPATNAVDLQLMARVVPKAGDLQVVRPSHPNAAGDLLKRNRQEQVLYSTSDCEGSGLCSALKGIFHLMSTSDCEGLGGFVVLFRAFPTLFPPQIVRV